MGAASMFFLCANREGIDGNELYTVHADPVAGWRISMDFFCIIEDWGMIKM